MTKFFRGEKIFIEDKVQKKQIQHTKKLPLPVKFHWGELTNSYRKKSSAEVRKITEQSTTKLSHPPKKTTPIVWEQQKSLEKQIDPLLAAKVSKKKLVPSENKNKTPNCQESLILSLKIFSQRIKSLRGQIGKFIQK